MPGVCSEHKDVLEDPGCFRCVATPAMIMGLTEEEWQSCIDEAENTGVAMCHKCGFEQYRNHSRCTKCSVEKWDRGGL